MASTSIKMLAITNNNALSDECYTPNNAIEPLLKFLPKDKLYYDCTSGISNSIVNFLNNNNRKCLSSYTKNFLIDDIPNVDFIITNPPYSKKDKFIERCYNLGIGFALLLPVSAIQGQKRGKMFSKYGIQLIVLNKRIDFTGKGSPHFGVAWFCYGLNLSKDINFV